MLRKKLCRDLRKNFGQFFSVFLLSMLAVMLFTGLEGNVIGAKKARNVFHDKTVLADNWLYGEGFSDDDADKIKSVGTVGEVQPRLFFSAEASEYDNATLYVYAQNSNKVSKPYLIDGDEYDPDDEEGIWIADRFAKAWDIKCGEKFTFKAGQNKVTRTVRGLIDSAEYEYMIAPDDLTVDFHHIGYIYISYNSVKEIFGAELPYNQIALKAESDNEIDEKKVSEAIDGNYSVMSDRNAVAGIARLDSELQQHDGVSWGFSFIFIIISMLVIITSMNRMVARQRTQIGTLNTLGMKTGRILFHYVSFSLLVSVLGAAIGFILGTFKIGQKMVDKFSGENGFTVPDWKTGFDGSSILILLLVIGSSCFAAFLSCRKILRLRPAESLRPAPPVSGKNCIFEKLPFWDKLGFTARYDLRDVSRAKLRTIMGIIGTACGMLILSASLGMFGTIDNVSDWSFNKIQTFNYQMKLEKKVTTEQADELSEKYSGELVMSASIEAAAQPHAVSDEKEKVVLTVIEGKGMYNVTDADKNIVELKEGQAALTAKTAEKLGLKKGDKVYWHKYDENQWYESEIGVISRAPESMGITMLRSELESDGVDFSPYMMLTNEDISGFDGEEAATVRSHSELEEAYNSNMSVMTVLFVIMLIFALLLIIIVIYNSGNLSFYEREKEFATLKVIGFSSKKIRKLLELQNVWVAVIGVILGMPFAKRVLESIMNSNGENYDYQAVITIPGYLAAAAFVLIVSAFVSFMFSRKIRKLDMVGTFKGIE